MNIKKHKKGLSRAQSRGFSLVELLVVITIIAILSVTAFVALGGQTANARNSRRQQDLAALQSALEVYYLQNNNAYPATAALAAELVPNFMNKLPVDPSTNADYDYFANATGKKYVLAATLEIGDTHEAYVVTNATDAEMGAADDGQGVTINADGTFGGGCTVEPDGGNKTTCAPYAL